MTGEAPAPVDVQELATAVADAVEEAIIGKREAVELVLFALLADGHVLIEDLPGLGKTLLARSFAQVCAMDFARIQFTPDLIPSDITGASIYDRSSGDFTFERAQTRAEIRHVYDAVTKQLHVDVAHGPVPAVDFRADAPLVQRRTDAAGGPQRPRRHRPGLGGGSQFKRSADALRARRGAACGPRHERDGQTGRHLRRRGLLRRRP